MPQRRLIGPFTQLLTFDNLSLKGPLSDDQLEIINYAGIIVENSKIVEIGIFDELIQKANANNFTIEELKDYYVVLPGLIDAHTHLCWAGSRVGDYAMRLEGKSYLEITKNGGGIWKTVRNTRKSTLNELVEVTIEHAERHIKDGVTTIEVKSGYGLTIADELKMLKAINLASQKTTADLIPTCLAAHILPTDFSGTENEYLKLIVHELFPQLKTNNLSNRIDIYIEKNAFSIEQARYYLTEAKKSGFDCLVHADQFTKGGSSLAIEFNALSADHLEASGTKEIQNLASSNTIPIALPGASLGLAEPFAPARKLLNAGSSLAIASDWNPGTAPMGDLLVQASILGIYEKLTITETLAGLTYRAAAALKLSDRGILKPGLRADFIAFRINDYREILYNQGKIKPEKVWKDGVLIK